MACAALVIGVVLVVATLKNSMFGAQIETVLRFMTVAVCTLIVFRLLFLLLLAGAITTPAVANTNMHYYKYACMCVIV